MKNITSPFLTAHTTKDTASILNLMRVTTVDAWKAITGIYSSAAFCTKNSLL